MPSSLVALVPTASISGVPRLPPQKLGRPVASAMAPHRLVTVDLPLVPVIPTIGAEMNRLASSISPVMVMPLARALAIAGRLGGTPGDSTIRSAATSDSAEIPPTARLTEPAESSDCRFASSFASAASVRSSQAVTCAPRAAQKRATARPLFPSPTTATRRPARSMDAATSAP